MNLTLNDLDQAFENLWQHSGQIPALLITWQDLLDEFLLTVDFSRVNYQEVEFRLQYWDEVLAQYKTTSVPHEISGTVH